LGTVWSDRIRFHGFVAAPVLEWVSLVFRLGYLAALQQEVAFEVGKERAASKTLLSERGVCGLP
jgi:hypothetical protein